MDAVSEVLIDRGREMSGMDRMFGASVIAHVGLVAFVILAPPGWFGGTMQKEPETVMTISLGGPVGPQTSMTTLGARPVQAETLEARKAIEPVRPPAAKAPEMIESTKQAPKKNEAKVQTTAKDAKSKTPIKGAEVRPGTSPTDTAPRGMGFGLSAGGGLGASGSYLDVADFCCPEYLATMVELIKRNWNDKQQVDGQTLMKFTIQRNGELTAIVVERSSGYQPLDFMAERSLRLTRQLPPLPGAFPDATLPVHLVFDYHK